MSTITPFSNVFPRQRPVHTGSTKYPEHLGLTRIGQFAAETPAPLALDPLRLVNDVPDSRLDRLPVGVIAKTDVRLPTGLLTPPLSGEVESADSSMESRGEGSELVLIAEGELDRRTRSSCGNGTVGEAPPQLLPPGEGRTPARSAANWGGRLAANARGSRTRRPCVSFNASPFMIPGSVKDFLTPSPGAGDSSRRGEGTALSSAASEVSIWDIPNAGREVEMLGGRERTVGASAASPSEMTEGARDLETGMGDWSRMWSIMWSRVARLRLRNVISTFIQTMYPQWDPPAHLAPDLPFPIPANGRRRHARRRRRRILGHMLCRFLLEFAIICPLNQHKNGRKRQDRHTPHLNGRPFHVPLADMPVPDGRLELGLVPEFELFSERLRGTARNPDQFKHSFTEGGNVLDDRPFLPDHLDRFLGRDVECFHQVRSDDRRRTTCRENINTARKKQKYGTYSFPPDNVPTPHPFAHPAAHHPGPPAPTPERPRSTARIRRGDKGYRRRGYRRWV
jgi:hypothetical protein